MLVEECRGRKRSQNPRRGCVCAVREGESEMVAKETADRVTARSGSWKTICSGRRVVEEWVLLGSGSPAVHCDAPET